ncbi:hypothetical protein CASFOL_002093 [Castilleja foliolosa]|uniref:Helitron helicase-like domain-containing protein n=1 Tax=Castilleja foliolosa TaxID=1961234 RepID=A0ABD3EDJ8_9LAMI
MLNCCTSLQEKGGGGGGGEHDWMNGKRIFDCSAHEVGESSRSRRSRRLPNRTNFVPAETLAKPTYFDDGDCEFICEYCSAFFWFAERITRGPLHFRPRYTHCCKGGAVRLPFPLCPPAAFKLLFEDSDFMDNVRVYNNMFSMTSFGARIDDAVNDGRGPYMFKISGQVSHWISSICPPTNEGPRFLQLYIYDTINEVPSRLRFFESSDHRSRETLKCCNEYVRLFRSAADLCDTCAECNYSVNYGDYYYSHHPIQIKRPTNNNDHPPTSPRSSSTGLPLWAAAARPFSFGIFQ